MQSRITTSREFPRFIRLEMSGGGGSGAWGRSRGGADGVVIAQARCASPRFMATDRRCFPLFMDFSGEFGSETGQAALDMDQAKRV